MGVRQRLSARIKRLLAPKAIIQPSLSTTSAESDHESTDIASLETMPPEIFQVIGSYLACFDKASLSLTSKNCRALLGTFDCPGYTSWAAFLIINATFYPPYQRTYLLPQMMHLEENQFLAFLNHAVSVKDQFFPFLNDTISVEDQFFPFLNHAVSPDQAESKVLETFEKVGNLFRVFYTTHMKQKWFKDPRVGNLHLEKPTKPGSSIQGLASLRPSPLLSHYFPGLEYPECTLAYFYAETFWKYFMARKVWRIGAFG